MREPIEEQIESKVIQNPGKCQHVWIREGKAKGNENKSLVAYVCKKCGLGKLVDESIEG